MSPSACRRRSVSWSGPQGRLRVSWGMRGTKRRFTFMSPSACRRRSVSWSRSKFRIFRHLIPNIKLVLSSERERDMLVYRKYWEEEKLTSDSVQLILPCRVSDPDPYSESGSRSRRAKMTHKSRKKLRNFMFWSAGCSLLRAEGFFCNLDVG